MLSQNNDLKAGRDMLVTGASGRLGRELIIELLRKGYVVRALVRNKESCIHLPSGVIPYVGSITDQELIKRACHNTKAVFHLAAIVSEYRSNAKDIISTNYDSTIRIAKECAANKSKLIFASTLDVYGKKRKGRLTEESIPRPTDIYGHSKMLAERAIAASGAEFTILRIATMYGKSYDNAFFKVLRAIGIGKAYIIGKGDNKLSMVSSSDVVRAMISAIEKGKNSIYNISDGTSFSQRDLFNIAADLLKVRRPSKRISEIIVRIVAKKYGIDSDELRFITSDRDVSIEKARSELGFSPSTDINGEGPRIVERFLAKHRSSISYG